MQQSLRAKQNPYSSTVWIVVAIVTGLVGGGMMTGLMEAMGHYFIPPPQPVDPNNPYSIRPEDITVSMILFVLAAWFVGTFFGTFVASRVVKASTAKPSIIVGGFFFVAGLVNLIAIPSPLWFWVIGLGCFFPATWCGHFVSARIQKQE